MHLEQCSTNDDVSLFNSLYIFKCLAYGAQKQLCVEVIFLLLVMVCKGDVRIYISLNRHCKLQHNATRTNIVVLIIRPMC